MKTGLARLVGGIRQGNPKPAVDSRHAPRLRLPRCVGGGAVPRHADTHIYATEPLPSHAVLLGTSIHAYRQSQANSLCHCLVHSNMSIHNVGPSHFTSFTSFCMTNIQLQYKITTILGEFKLPTCTTCEPSCPGLTENWLPHPNVLRSLVYPKVPSSFRHYYLPMATPSAGPLSPNQGGDRELQEAHDGTSGADVLSKREAEYPLPRFVKGLNVKPDFSACLPNLYVKLQFGVNDHVD